MRSTDELIERVLGATKIPALRRRRDIERELRSHLEELVTSAMDRGLSAAAIEAEVLAHFGDPSQVGRCFGWVYRYERSRVRAAAFLATTLVIAGCVSLVVLLTQAGLALGLGTPIMKVFASPHTAIETLDIVASVAAYLGLTSLETLFETRRFQKGALLLAAIVTVVMAVSSAMGWHVTFVLYGLVNGIFIRAIQLYVTSRQARVAILLICFALAGLIAGLQWTASYIALFSTCVSWLAMGIGYQLMSDLSARVDAALLNGCQRIHEGY